MKGLPSMEFENVDLEESATQTGIKWLGRVIAIGTILITAGFGDVMYIQLMQSHFPAGLLLAVCYVGAFTSFLAIAYMLIGKSILFTPGKQMTLAWLIFLAELALIAFNIILVFQNDGASSTGFLAFWFQLAPATPVFNMAGVAMLFFLDEDSKMRHEDMELAWDIKRANRRQFKAMARARLKLQEKQLGYLVTSLERAVSSPQSLGTIEQTAIDLNAYMLSQLSGRSYAPQIASSTPSTVEADAPTGPIPQVLPTEPKRGPMAAVKGFFGVGKEKGTDPLWEAESRAGMAAHEARLAEERRAAQPQITPEIIAQFMQMMQKNQEPQTDVPNTQPLNLPDPAKFAEAWSEYMGSGAAASPLAKDSQNGKV